jgi:hypothetical protein
MAEDAELATKMRYQLAVLTLISNPPARCAVIGSQAERPANRPGAWLGLSLGTIALAMNRRVPRKELRLTTRYGPTFGRQGIAACGFEFGASPAYSGAGPVMLGTAFATAGALGGVVVVGAPAPASPDAVTSALCVQYTAMPPRAIMAPPPTIAAHNRSFGTTVMLMSVCSIVRLETTYTRCPRE